MAFAVSPILDVHLGQLLAVIAGQPRGEGRTGFGRQMRQDRPILFRFELLDLGFPVADQPQRDRLDAARRAGARQLAPKHWRQGEANQIVERAAREIGIDQRRVDVARIGDRIEHRILRDRVEDDALDRLVLDRLFLAEHLKHMPGDRLALAVRVRGENEPVSRLHGRRDLVQPLVGGRVDLPRHGEVFVRLHRTVLGRQIAHMAERGQHLVARTQIFVDGFRLGGRLDDDDFHG